MCAAPFNALLLQSLPRGGVTVKVQTRSPVATPTSCGTNNAATTVGGDRQRSTERTAPEASFSPRGNADGSPSCPVEATGAMASKLDGQGGSKAVEFDSGTARGQKRQAEGDLEDGRSVRIGVVGTDGIREVEDGTPIAMDVDEQSTAQDHGSQLGGDSEGGGGSCAPPANGSSGEPLEQKSSHRGDAMGVTSVLPGFSAVSSTDEDMAVHSSSSRRGGVTVTELAPMEDDLGDEEEAVSALTPAGPAEAELPLLELEKQSTVDTLFELMESGQSIGVLVWDLLMKMPTNMCLLQGFR